MQRGNRRSYFHRAVHSHHPLGPLPSQSHLQRTRHRRNYPFYSERVTMHCQWEENPQSCPFPLGFRHPAGGGPSHRHRQHAQQNGKDRACGSGDKLADRQTDRHTDRDRQIYVLITVCRQRSRGRNRYAQRERGV